MRLYQILNESGRQLQPCPFPASKIKDPLYHGTAEEFSKFLRPAHGIYVTPWEDWALDHYGNGKIVVLYANVTKMITLDPGGYEVDPFYDMDYEEVSRMIAKWSKQGYDCCKFGGESDSMVLFNNIRIVNAITGDEM